MPVSAPADDGEPGELPDHRRLLARGSGRLAVVGLEPQQHRHRRHCESRMPSAPAVHRRHFFALG